MSLLMDALKRAEKARQSQADSERSADLGPAETQGLTLDPIEQPDAETPTRQPPDLPSGLEERFAHGGVELEEQEPREEPRDLDLGVALLGHDLTHESFLMRPACPSQFETSSPSEAYLNRPCTMIEPICLYLGKL